MYYALAVTIAISAGIAVFWLKTQRENSVAATNKARQAKAAERARFAQSGQAKTEATETAAQNELQKQRRSVRNFGNR
jgi:uncharacterized protein HemX